MSFQIQFVHNDWKGVNFRRYFDGNRYLCYG